MTTATKKTEYPVPAKEARQINKDIAKDTPYVAVTGNTYPVRRALWTMGGDYDKVNKCYLMPAHQAVEAQALVDKIGAKIVENMAKAKAKKEAKALEVAATPA